MSAILLVYLCYVIGACEGASFDHVFSGPIWSHGMSRVLGGHVCVMLATGV